MELSDMLQTRGRGDKVAAATSSQKSLLLKIILRLALGITLAEIRANFGIKICFSFLRERMPEIVL